jgi:hypothetical protein
MLAGLTGSQFTAHHAVLAGGQLYVQQSFADVIVQ